MAEFTDDDVTRLAEMMRPKFGTYGAVSLARHLLNEGVTLPDPPPDPAEVFSEAYYLEANGSCAAARYRSLIAAGWTIEPPAAKVQEADRG